MLQNMEKLMLIKAITLKESSNRSRLLGCERQAEIPHSMDSVFAELERNPIKIFEFSSD